MYNVLEIRLYYEPQINNIHVWVYIVGISAACIRPA